MHASAIELSLNWSGPLKLCLVPPFWDEIWNSGHGHSKVGYCEWLRVLVYQNLLKRVRDKLSVQLWIAVYSTSEQCLWKFIIVSQCVYLWKGLRIEIYKNVHKKNCVLQTNRCVHQTYTKQIDISLGSQKSCCIQYIQLRHSAYILPQSSLLRSQNSCCTQYIQLGHSAYIWP